MFLLQVVFGSTVLVVVWLPVQFVKRATNGFIPFNVSLSRYTLRYLSSRYFSVILRELSQMLIWNVNIAQMIMKNQF